MITTYENLMKRVDDLRRVENYCQERGKTHMASIWRKQRTDMEAIAVRLSAKQAGKPYDQEAHIGYVVIKHKAN